MQRAGAGVIGLTVTGVLALAATAVAVPAVPAKGAGGPAIPTEGYGAGGVSGPSGEPSSEHRYVTLGTADGAMIQKIATDGGLVRRYRELRDYWALPAVTLQGDAGGLAADGETVVLIRPAYRPRGETSFLVLDGRNLRTRERLELDGRFSFDAISPDGRLIYLVEYPDPRDPLSYSVRAYDLRADRFRPEEIVDPDGAGKPMTGQPVARETSPDGRWAYTLYGGGDEVFIHALDTSGVTAVCVDLPQFDDGRNFFRLGLDVDPASGAITVLERGDPAATVDPETFEVGEPPAPGADAAQSGDGPPWYVLGGAVALILAGSLFVARRRRKRTREPVLERLVRVDAGGEAQRDREREPVG